ncbi:hypothetical protein NCF85_08820 [Qipengyuania citrea]|uniref:Uncharacterized protein n=1 Tax=Qipengyuania citrea TaxID=225971 RepID=A0ABY4U282_9SPHN|nr:hypothetical protein [Qipengyuania citrea]USA60222.1 hypothetical protein NCF85_08820 [Qipengyuania citrea]
MLQPVNAKINLRPVRVGFLVNPRDSASLSKVMRLATTMWGGLMCPIIPVPRRLPAHWKDEFSKTKPIELAHGYLNFFEPDVLVQTEADQLERLGLGDDQSFGKRRYHSLDAVIRHDVGMDPELNVGLNMCNRYEHLFTTEFQFAKIVKPRILQFHEGPKAATTFFEAAFGLFPRDNVLPYFTDVYRQTLGAEDATPSAQTWLELIEGRAGYPLHYTCRDMDLQTGQRSSPSAFIFDPAKPSDVIDFWNFRIFTRNVMPVNSHWLAHSREALAEFVRRNFRPLPTNRNGVMIHSAVHVGRSLDFEAVADELNLAEFDLPKGSLAFQSWYHKIWRSWDDEEKFARPVASILSAAERDVQLTPTGNDRITIRYPSLAPEFDGGTIGIGPKWINTISVKQYISKPDIAQVLPSAGFESRKHYPTVGAGDEFVSREGFVTFHQFAHDEGYLELPSPMQAIQSWLAAEDIEAKPSDAGRVADQIIESVGGLGGTHAFRDLSIVEQLDKMARRRRDYSDGSSDEFEDRSAPVSDWLRVLKPLEKKTWGRWRTLETLVNRGMLKVGVSLECTHCTQKNWYGLDDLKTTLRCSRCVKEFPFPQGNTKKAPWAYRIVGPFATPHFARGGYTVALALRFLDDELGSLSEMTYSTGIELTKNGITREADFLAWRSTDGVGLAPRNPITLIGECKSLGADTFKEEDLENLKELGALMPGAYLVAACLKTKLSADEVARLSELAAWGWSQQRPSPLIVLTGLELFGDGPFSHVWEKAGERAKAAIERHRHIFDFPTLAAATQEVHLAMEPDQVDDLRYGPRRRARVARKRKSRTNPQHTKNRPIRSSNAEK